MLQTIREHTQGWIAGIIIGIIILTFALWGIHSYFIGGGSSNEIAEVNGTPIYKEQIAVVYERLRRQLANTNHPIQNDTALKEQALQALIQTEVLKQASYAEGFRIFDTQVDNYLQTIPEFQENGQFSIDKFERVLSTSLLSPAEFYNLIQTSLQIEQPKLGIIFTSFALTDETMTNIAIINQEREIEYTLLPTTTFLTQTMSITPEQIKRYYEDHQKDYMTTEQVTVDYIQVSLPDLFKTIHPKESDLKNFYSENISTYSAPVSGQQEVKPKPFTTVYEQVRESYIRQQAEEKFADIREQLSNMTYEHPDTLQYAAETLNLPIKTSDVFIKDKVGKGIAQYKKVRDVAFSHDVLKLKNNSDVLQIDPQTIVVLRINKFTPSAVVPLNVVSTQIEDKLRKNAAESRAELVSQSLTKKLQNGANPVEIGNAYKLKWVNTGLVSRYDKKIERPIMELAFNLPYPNPNDAKQGSYGVAKLADGYAIVGVKAVKVGVISDKKQYPVFAEQVQNSEGLLEYELYKRSKVKQAKIEIQAHS